MGKLTDLIPYSVAGDPLWTLVLFACVVISLSAVGVAFRLAHDARDAENEAIISENQCSALQSENEELCQKIILLRTENQKLRAHHQAAVMIEKITENGQTPARPVALLTMRCGDKFSTWPAHLN